MQHDQRRPPPARAPRPSVTGSNLTVPPRLTRALPHRPLPKDVSFPAARGAGPRALARARRLQRVAAPPRGRAAVRLLRGPADRQRPPRLPPRAGARVQGHLPALQDDARLLLRPQGRLGLPRPAGRDRRPAAARDRVQARRSRNTASRSSTQKCRESVFEFLEDWTRLTERIGYWVDLDDPYRTLDTELHRVGLVGAEAAVGQGPALRGLQGRPVLPARRHGALQPRGLAGLPGRRGPERLRPLPGHQAGRRAARGRPAARVDDDALDAGLQRRRRRRPRAHLRAHDRRRGAGRGARRARARRGREVADRFTGADMVGAGYEPPFPFIPASEYGEKGHTVLPGDFVSAEDGTGIVHTAIAFGEDDFRLGAEQGLNVINPVRADGTYDERIGPYAGRFVKDADDDLIEDLRGARPRCSAPSGCCTPTRTAGAAARRCSTTPSRPGTSARRSSRTGCWRPTRPSTGTREHIKHGRFGRWLENNVDWALSPRALLGHAAADLAQRGGRDGLRRLLRGARGAARASSSRTRTARSSTTSRSRRRPAASRCGACPR